MDLKLILKECDFNLAAKALSNKFKGGVLKNELIVLLDAFISRPSLESATALISYEAKLVVIFDECRPGGFYTRYPNYAGKKTERVDHEENNMRPDDAPKATAGDTIMDKKYYLAICEDRPGGPHGMKYTVYFLNNSENKIDKVVASSWGMADDIETSVGTAVRGEVGPKKAIEIGVESDDDFDFMLFFDIEVFIGNRIERASFRTYKYLPAFHKPKPIPTFNKEGFLFAPRRESDGPYIKQVGYTTKDKRSAYAEKKAREWVESLPPEEVEKCGYANLLSDEIHRLLLTLPDKLGPK